MGFIDGFLDKMKLNGNYDEDEEYDGYDDDEEEDVTPKVRNSRKKNDDIFLPPRIIPMMTISGI